MKSKRFAQYVCAGILAFGFGLNIQNALTGYGISEGTTSITAEEGSNSGSNSSSGSSSGVPEKKGWYCKQGSLKSTTTISVWLKAELAGNLKKIGGPNAAGEFKYEKVEYVYYYDCAQSINSDVSYSQCKDSSHDH